MNNTGKFAGFTAIISGSSRGIGLAIARKLAADGANITIAAKTAEPHAKLAEEIKKAGGKALPCVMDVRDENSVREAVDATVREFGGIDICVNNASAISLTRTEATDLKRYDLMHSVNTRGTFLLSKHCIPYLRRSKRAHILNIAPPLEMKAKWFAHHVAYTMAKYGMSMCALGMAEELRSDGIAANCLWPRTSIWTSAMEMLSGGGSNEGSRTPEIVADAAYVMLSRNPREYTGNFATDEEVLKEEGVSDFESYACKPGAPLDLDLFVQGFDYGKYMKSTSRKQSRSKIKDATDS